MGMLRDAMPAAAHKLIRAEIAKDFVHLTVGEIESRLKA
jgi:hypothetical protein